MSAAKVLEREQGSAREQKDGEQFTLTTQYHRRNGRRRLKFVAHSLAIDALGRRGPVCEAGGREASSRMPHRGGSA